MRFNFGVLMEYQEANERLRWVVLSFILEVQFLVHQKISVRKKHMYLSQWLPSVEVTQGEHRLMEAVCLQYVW